MGLPLGYDYFFGNLFLRFLMTMCQNECNHIGPKKTIAIAIEMACIHELFLVGLNNISLVVFVGVNFVKML